MDHGASNDAGNFKLGRRVIFLISLLYNVYYFEVDKKIKISFLDSLIHFTTISLNLSAKPGKLKEVLPGVCLPARAGG